MHRRLKRCSHYGRGGGVGVITKVYQLQG
jgi:hypothetical protein